MIFMHFTIFTNNILGRFNIILPFITNSREIEVIRNGFVDESGNAVVQPLDAVIRRVVGDSDIEVNIGANIESPSSCC